VTISRFYSLDVETANSDAGSICQVGIGLFEGGEVVRAWKSYVDPEEQFNFYNTRVHGITAGMIRGAPRFFEIYGFLRKEFEHSVVVHHMPFDRVAFHRAYARYRLEPFPVYWLDSATVARHTWEQFSRSGYGLANLAGYLGIRFKHHDALEDSITAGKIVVQACLETGLDVRDWL
jgi:DNA polymerase-3 subunit epsilon